MFGRAVYDVRVFDISGAVERAAFLLRGLGFHCLGHGFVCGGCHGLLKVVRGRERWFYVVFLEGGLGCLGFGLDLSVLRELSVDSRLEDVLFVLGNGRVYSVSINEFLLFGDDCFECLSLSRVLDVRRYNDWPVGLLDDDFK